MKRARRLSAVVLLVGIVMVFAPPKTRAQDAFVDELITSSGSLDIGERTAFSPIGPPIPPAASINGPVSAGTVRGQFEFTCGEGGTPAQCPDSAYAASHFDWKWGVLKVTSYTPSTVNAQFLEIAGKNLFSSDLANDEGFTFVETQGFTGNSFTRLAHFEFNLEGAGITLDPGFSYVIFGLLSEFPVPDRVPGEGPGPLNQAEESIFTSAFWDGPPFQFHQAFPTFDPNQNINQLATGRLIPVAPEPVAAPVILLGFAVLFRRRPLMRGRV